MGDDVDAVLPWRWTVERTRIGELAAKVETADEREDFAKLRPLVASEPPGKLVARFRIAQQLGTLAGAVRGREQEDALTRRQSL